jgi:glutamyl-tRNA reductase
MLKRIYNNNMRKNPEESYKNWADRVQNYEYGYALQRIAMGDVPNTVMEEMSKRIMRKLLHPIIVDLKKHSIVDYDPIESRKVYEENYLKKYGPKADHIDVD